MRPSASAAAVDEDPESLSPYWRFHQAVAEAQLRVLAAPRRPPAGGHLGTAGESGPDRVPSRSHRAAGGQPRAPAQRPGRWRATGPDAAGPDTHGSWCCRAAVPANGSRPGDVALVSSDPASLSFLADSCADGVIAEDRALSMQLAAEHLIADIARVLRPAGRVLACVDSLVLGMAMLAEQRHWAELTDLPHAEVVLVPWPDGTITRCFGAEQLRELFDDAGLDVMWIRPRARCLPLHRGPRPAPGPERPAPPGRSRTGQPARRIRRGPAGDLRPQTRPPPPPLTYRDSQPPPGRVVIRSGPLLG